MYQALGQAEAKMNKPELWCFGILLQAGLSPPASPLQPSISMQICTSSLHLISKALASIS